MPAYDKCIQLTSENDNMTIAVVPGATENPMSETDASSSCPLIATYHEKN
jgi:hypothetical protein